MIRLFCILFPAFACIFASPGDSCGQVSEIPGAWKKVSVCQLNFLIPKDLKNQNVRGIDSCVAEFKNSKIRLALDYGMYSGSYGNEATMEDFKEEFTEIDGKKSQLVTFKDKYTRDSRKFVAGLYVLISEGSGMKMSLNIRINVKGEKDLETAKQIFRSIRFEEYKPFAVEPLSMHRIRF